MALDRWICISAHSVGDTDDAVLAWGASRRSASFGWPFPVGRNEHRSDERMFDFDQRPRTKEICFERDVPNEREDRFDWWSLLMDRCVENGQRSPLAGIEDGNRWESLKSSADWWRKRNRVFSPWLSVQPGEQGRWRRPNVTRQQWNGWNSTDAGWWHWEVRSANPNLVARDVSICEKGKEMSNERERMKEQVYRCNVLSNSYPAYVRCMTIPYIPAEVFF